MSTTTPEPAWTLVAPLPARGEVFFDRRGRALRVSSHEELGLVVLSLWRGENCVGTFRLPTEEVPDLVDTLVRGLAAASRRSDPAGSPPAVSYRDRARSARLDLAAASASQVRALRSLAGTATEAARAHVRTALARVRDRCR